MIAKDGTTVALVRKKKPPARDPDQSCLIVIHGRQIGNRYFLSEKDLVIGRSEEAQIRIDDETLSKKHALLFRNKRGRWGIKDLQSTNGTFVNERAVSETNLKDGDLIQVGKTVLKYLSGGHIENRYYEEVYRLIHFDPLTQSYNKLFFLRTLEQELNRCRRYAHPLSLAILDLDHFKTVNDRFGHLTGDLVLKELAALIRNQIRSTDLFARYGGEEFALILPETDGKTARRICEKLRKEIEDHRFSFEDREMGITVSMGLASVEETGNRDFTTQEFISLADDRLYEAKRKGRNRVIG